MGEVSNKQTASSTLADESLANKIFNLRGENVMLDRDLAELYAVKNIRLREQVKRNIDKFPPSSF